MKNYLMILCFSVATISASGQGSLTPPGAPAPTMRTLQQIEPRTPIEGGTVVGTMIITEPGSYYLLGDRTSSGSQILIRTNGVTIDLNGYTLIYSGSSSSSIGIHVDGSASSPLERVSVRNGSIIGYGNGIRLSAASGCVIENVKITDAKAYAFYVDATGGVADGNIFRQCVALRPSWGGFIISGANGNARGNLLINCSAIASIGTESPVTGYGFQLFGGNPGNVSGNLLENCSSAGNHRHGFLVTASSGTARANRLTECIAVNNGSDGFSLSSSALGSLEGNVIQNCQSISNGLSGFLLSGNGGAYGNIISRNSSGRNAMRGIWTSGSLGGLTTGNLCVSNTVANYLLTGADINGPIVTTIGTLGTSGADAHPHANYAR